MKAGSEPTKRERDVAHAEECCNLANDRFHLQEQVRHLQAATSASDARYQARVRELEEALKYAIDDLTIRARLAEDDSLNISQSCLNQMHRALSTPSPDTALQKELLEARIADTVMWADWFESAPIPKAFEYRDMFLRHAQELRAQLTELGE